jgi:hypothetical protein
MGPYEQEVWNWLYLEEAAEQQRLAMEANTNQHEHNEDKRPERSVSVQFRYGHNQRNIPTRL